jgi:5'-nucleotidase
LHILLSNDDGIHAPGLAALANSLKQIGKVTIAAPDRERSATGHAITVYYPLRVRQVPYADDITAYAVDGTPADCVRLALEALIPADDPCTLVVSGINKGVNLGTDVIYSGTVSAAVEAAVMTLPAIAVSMVDDRQSALPWQSAAQITSQIVLATVKRKIDADTVLNINIPALPYHQIKGVQVTRLGMRRYKDGVHKREDPSGETYYWRAGTAVDIEGQEGTDAQAVSAGYVSLTPIHLDMTHYPSLSRLESWNIRLDNPVEEG